MAASWLCNGLRLLQCLTSMPACLCSQQSGTLCLHDLSTSAAEVGEVVWHCQAISVQWRGTPAVPPVTCLALSTGRQPGKSQQGQLPDRVNVLSTTEAAEGTFSLLCRLCVSLTAKYVCLPCTLYTSINDQTRHCIPSGDPKQVFPTQGYFYVMRHHLLARVLLW